MDPFSGGFASWKKETFVEIEELKGEEYYLDLTEFASETAKEARPGGYKYRLVSTLDHTGSGAGKHYTANSYRPVKPETAEAAESQSDAAQQSKAKTEAKDYLKWYSFNDL